MSRKDFELIAGAVKAWGDAGACASKKLVREFLADALATTNPLFDREKFLEACKSTK